MERGPSISPVTRQPRGTEGGPGGQARKQEDSLKQKAEKLGVVYSHEGKQLQGILHKRLMARVDVLIREDPEANSYAEILKEMGNMENLARQAVDRLYERTVGRQA